MLGLTTVSESLCEPVPERLRHDLIADSYAEAADDTLVRISYDKRMVIFGILWCSSHLQNLSGMNVILVSQVDQLTFKANRDIRIPRHLLEAGYSLFFRVNPFRYYFAEVVLSFFRESCGISGLFSFSVFKVFSLMSSLSTT